MKRNLFTVSLPAAIALGVGALLGGGHMPAGLAGADRTDGLVGADRFGVVAVDDISKVVAVVDLDKARVAFPLSQKVENDLRDFVKGMNGELDALETRAKTMEGELDDFEPGTDARRKRAFDVEMLRFELSQRGKFAKADFQRLQEEKLREVNFKLREQLAAFAKLKGYQLVLRIRRDVPKQQQSESNFVEDVLFAADKVDATQAFVDFLLASK